MLCASNDDKKMILRFPDQAFDKLSFKYKTQMVRLDIKKIYCHDSFDSQRFYILASSRIRSKLNSPLFDLSELHFLLEQSLKTLFNMVPFELKNALLNQVDFGVKTTNYFQGMEVLFGKSLSDLFLKNPTRIK